VVPEAILSRPLRFRPPDVALSPDVGWVLLRGFGPAGAAAPKGFRRETVIAVARRLDLAARIAARIPRDALREEIGADGASSLAASRGVVALGNERHLEVAREVAGCAALLGTPLVFLKGTALHLTERTSLDSRTSSDVDVLAAEDDLQVLADALLREGFRPDDGGPPCEHQLPALYRGPGESIDLHRFLPGVRLPGERTFAGAGSLARRGLLRPLPGLAGECSAPSPAVLAAHALVHGVAQNGFAPGSYPGMRMLGDLLDLGVREADAGSLCDEAASFASHVRPGEVQAVWALCAALAAAEPFPPVLRPRGRPADVLLAHIVAGATDAAYRDSLKLRALGGGPSRLPRALAWTRDAARALYPSRAHLEALHGGPLPTLRATALRLARAFRLAGRALRSARSVATVRRRPRMPWARISG
jgi:hypothetical protein